MSCVDAEGDKSYASFDTVGTKVIEETPDQINFELTFEPQRHHCRAGYSVGPVTGWW